MTFLRRLFSSDYRRAVAAEAAGDYAEAARHYGLCGERARVAAMHLLRAERTKDPAEEIAALRDAGRWADAGTPAHAEAMGRLGRALFARARREGATTERDRRELREAAEALEAAGAHLEAAEAWETLGSDEDAARAYGQAGLVDKMELALAREEKRERGARRLKGAFEDYELYMQGGDRESAWSALRQAVELAESKGDYRRLLDELETRRLTGGIVSLRRRPSGPVVIAAAAPRLTIGRDPGCEIVLRGGGISRTHLELRRDGDAAWFLRDAGSRHGTTIGGLPVIGEVPLSGEGRLGLGPDCELAWSAQARVVELEVMRGPDRGVVIRLAAPGAAIAIGEGASLTFDGGRPYFAATGVTVRLGGARVTGRVQLIRADLVAAGDAEWEVL